MLVCERKREHFVRSIYGEHLLELCGLSGKCIDDSYYMELPTKAIAFPLKSVSRSRIGALEEERYSEKSFHNLA